MKNITTKFFLNLKNPGFLFFTVVILIGLIVWAITLTGQSEEPLNPGAENAEHLQIGITYVELTPQLSAYYDLDVDHGALVTNVAKGSLAELAGICEGDVILIYNGTTVSENAPLFGMMRTCSNDQEVQIELWRESHSEIVDIVYAGY